MSGSGAGSPKRRRLSRSGDFRRVYRDGTSKATRYLVLYRFERDEEAEAEGDVRLGVSVSKKLGDSVDRNRVKRVLKEAFWNQVDRESLEQDIVIVARPGVGEVIESEGLDGAERCVREVLALESGKGAKRST